MGILSKFGLTGGNKKFTRFISKFGSKGSRSGWDISKAIDDGLKGNSVVASCVEKIIEGYDDVEWMIERRTNTGEWEVVEGHPLNKLIEHPNDTLTFTDMLKLCKINLTVAGNYLIQKIEGVNGDIISWNPLNVLEIGVEVDDDIIKHYTYGDIILDVKDVIHGMNINPEDLTWGYSELEPISKEIDAYNYTMRNLLTIMRSGGVSPSLVYIDGLDDAVYDEDVEKLINEAIVKLSDNINDAAQNGGHVVVTGDFKMEPFLDDISKVGHLEKLRYLREVIAGKLKVPPVLIGDLQHATLANVVQYKRDLWESAIIPSLNHFYEVFNRDIALKYPGYRLNYSLDNVVVLREDLGLKIEYANKLKNLGISLSEINRMLDLGLTGDELRRVDGGE